MPKRIDKTPLIDQLKIIGHAYGMKGMANELNKPYSTLSNELREVEWAKPGFRDAMSMIEIAMEDDSPEQAQMAAGIMLDMIAESFGRIMYEIPAVNGKNPSRVMRLTARLTKEFSDVMEGLANAVDDGVIEHHEVKNCKRDISRLIRQALELMAYLDRVHSVPDGEGGMG